MRIAKAVYYKGQILRADKCTYQDYSHLGAACIACGEPVILRAAHTRVLGEDNIVDVTAAWVHRSKTYLPNQKDCELRTNVLSNSYVEQVNGEARGQRLELISQQFWQFFFEYDLPTQALSKQTNYNIKNATTEGLSIIEQNENLFDTHPLLRNIGFSNKYDLLEVLREMLNKESVQRNGIIENCKYEILTSNPKIQDDLDPKDKKELFDVFQQAHKELEDPLLCELHFTTLDEVLDFLILESNEQILKSLVIWNIIKMKVSDRDIQENRKKIKDKAYRKLSDINQKVVALAIILSSNIVRYCSSVHWTRAISDYLRESDRKLLLES